MALGLGTGLGKGGIIGSIPGVVTDNLVMKHMYPAGAVHPVSDGAAYFVRSATDAITLPMGAAFTPMVTGFSATMWVKLNDTTNSQMLLACANGTEQRMYIAAHAGTPSEWDFGLGNSQWTAGATDVTTEWTHIALTYDGPGDDAWLYVNGVADRNDSDNDADSFTDGTFGGNFSIGAHGDATSTTYALDGYMSNVGIWTRELTQPEVKSIMWKSYSDLSTDDVASLQGWYNLDVDASDSHSTENDGVFR